MSQFLPRSLNQVQDYDIQQIQQGNIDETYALAVAALVNQDVCTASNAQPLHRDSPLTSEDDEESSDSHTEPYIKTSKTPQQLQSEKEAKRAEMKAHKKAVKQEQSIKRLSKMKKKDKKQAIKNTKGKKNK